MYEYNSHFPHKTVSVLCAPHSSSLIPRKQISFKKEFNDDDDGGMEGDTKVRAHQPTLSQLNSCSVHCYRNSGELAMIPKGILLYAEQ